jgi:tetratricopeptide (TPR) repeat protein
MTKRKHGSAHGRLLFLALVLAAMVPIMGKTPTPAPSSRAKTPASSPAHKSERQDDSTSLRPARDLVLQEEGELKAEALAKFVEGAALEENGEIDKALEAYRQVLNVDPGQAELASRVATLLVRQDEFPEAIDILKDAIKANPKAADAYLQLAFIYSHYLKKTDQAVAYVNRALTLEPTNIDAYQRLYEIQVAAGDEKKARLALERAAKVQSSDPVFWTRLGKLYAAIIFKPDVEANHDDVAIVNNIFRKAAENAHDDAAILKEIADHYASSQQIAEAIPLYLRVLELQPEDANAREKLATGFILTNQSAKAIALLDEIIKQHPEKYQPYDLLAQVLDDQARGLQRENKTAEAKAAFSKAAANYEQSLLVNPSHAITYIRLAELLLGPVKDPEHAVQVLSEARRRFPETAEMVYYLGIALREAKHTQQAVATFEEALHEEELDSGEIANARFYFDYGATAEQAGLYDKAADLFKKSIALDPTNSAEACNYLAYMWAEQNSHLDEAAEMIQRALQADPKNGAFLDSLGWVEYRQGKYEQSLSDLLRAVQNMAHDDAVVHEHLGDTYLKLGRTAEALEAWQKARSLDPKNKNLAEKIENTKPKTGQRESPGGSPGH